MDLHNRVIGVLAGNPDRWDGVHDEAFRAMRVASENMVFLCGPCEKKSWKKRCKKCMNRRGEYRAISVGLSFGGGQGVSPSSCLFFKF